MNQGDLIEKVARGAFISKAQAERAINAVKGAITDSLRKNNKVTLVGFGTFAVSHRKARRGYNPYTNEGMRIPGMKAVRFTAGKQLKEAVNKRKKS
jgi:DNA-binding protein HU-beta